ncbi:MAG: penicillin acylase family protein, partial [Actinomycetota bacterium]
VGRKQLLDDGIASTIGTNGKVNLVELVQAMQVAATRDIRGAKVLPSMLDVMGLQSNPRISQALTVLSDWEAAGAHRRDLDGDGQYDNSAAVALMDAWWLKSLKAAFGPTLGSAFEAVPNSIDDKPGPGGSSYLEGWYGHLQKDLDSLRGSPVASPFSRAYCGNGSLTACRAALVASLSDAIATLETQFGTDPNTWNADEAGDKIAFSGLDLTGPKPMMWQNRPTFQQVLEFDAP